MELDRRIDDVPGPGSAAGTPGQRFNCSKGSANGVTIGEGSAYVGAGGGWTWNEHTRDSTIVEGAGTLGAVYLKLIFIWFPTLGQSAGGLIPIWSGANSGPRISKLVDLPRTDHEQQIVLLATFSNTAGGVIDAESFDQRWGFDFYLPLFG